eukprot:404490-Rhodomonas_salina.1
MEASTQMTMRREVAAKMRKAPGRQRQRQRQRQETGDRDRKTVSTTCYVSAAHRIAPSLPPNSSVPRIAQFRTAHCTANTLHDRICIECRASYSARIES